MNERRVWTKPARLRSRLLIKQSGIKTVAERTENIDHATRTMTEQDVNQIEDLDELGGLPA
jgi:hypothetical protein